MSIDRRGYPAYKELKGTYSFGSYVLSIDRVQGDPFASPSRLSIRADGARAAFPASFYKEKACRIALQDYINRLFYRECARYSFKAKGSGKSGLISVSHPGQEVLERSAVTIDPEDGSVLVRIACGFPANGRSINAGELSRMLFEYIPACARASLFYKNLPGADVKAVIDLAQDQQYIRSQLDALGLCAFVANGSILPRSSGVSDKPMQNGIPFVSPPSLEVTLTLPHKGTLIGMGIRKGITLIVGGGYHGKSTLLKALECGVYDHIAGDGREYVITDSTALKIRSEDGRSIKNTDISMFITDLPNGRDTHSFYTKDASGSTSQAANLIEGMESGTRVFLIDEDTCAANLMVRDELMQRVVNKKEEPITPFVERARPIYDACGISTVIVAGSSGSYFYIADTIIQMDRYIPKDITKAAKREAAEYAAIIKEAVPDHLAVSGSDSFAVPAFCRIPRPGTEHGRDDRIKAKSRGTDDIQLGHENIDLGCLEQIKDPEQTAALSYILVMAQKELIDGKRTMREIADCICRLLDEKGLAGLFGSSGPVTDLAMPRRQEILGCLNRCRSLDL